MIGTMGSFAFPSADLNEPLYVPFGAISSCLVADSEPHNILGEQEALDSPQSCFATPVSVLKKRC